MKISLKFKLVLLIEVFVILVSMVIGVTSFLFLSNAHEEQVIAQLQSITVLKRNEIGTFITDMVNEMEYMAKDKTTNPQFVAFLGDKKTDREWIIDYFSGLYSLEKRFTDLTLLDTEGEVVLSVNPADEGKFKSSELYFTNAQEESYVQNITYEASLGTTTMTTGTPIKNKKGELVGILVGRVNVNEINRLLSERTGLGETGESVLVNSSNLVINDLLKEPDSALKKTINTPQISRCLAGNTFGERVVDYHGDKVLGYYSWYPDIQSCLATKIDVSEAMSSINNTYVLLLVFTISAGIIAGLAGLYFGTKLFRPLKILKNEMKKIDEGNFDIYVDVNSNDELEDVANSFNAMAKKLKVSYTDLEVKVAENTKELNQKLDDLEQLNTLMVGRELKMIELKEQIKDKKK